MTCTIPRGLLVPNSNSGHRFRLQVLKLVNCNFDQFKDTQFADLGSSLRELSLSRVTFPHDDGDGGRILNSIIAGASLLQRLFLSSIVGIRRVQVGNLPSLKFLLFDQSPVEDLVITAVDSLEELFICDTPMGGDFVVSLMPNPKKLAVANVYQACKWARWKVDELISKAPSLESLSLKGSRVYMPPVYDEKFL